MLAIFAHGLVRLGRLHRMGEAATGSVGRSRLTISGGTLNIAAVGFGRAFMRFHLRPSPSSGVLASVCGTYAVLYYRGYSWLLISGGRYWALTPAPCRVKALALRIVAG